MLIILSFPFFVCLGAVVGSLLTTALHRFHRGEDLIARGFHCHGCGKRLGLGSLIPIISFLRQRGKCLDCGEKINPEYFIMELVNAVVYGLLSILFGFGAISFYMSLLFSLLLMIGLVDIRNQEVPVYLQLSLCIFVLLKVLFSPIDPLYAVACAAAYFALVELARIAAKALVKVEVIGGGDLILMAMSGLMLTMEYVSIFFILVGVFGTILGVTLKVRKKHSGPFPFTPIILPVLYFLLLHHYTLGHYGR